MVSISFTWWFVSPENSKPIPILNPKWMKPSMDVCINNGGVVDRDGCSATWNKAKKICQVMGGRLSTHDKFQRVIRECEKNTKCYEDKGFSLWSGYWSSTPYSPHNRVWIAYFNTAHSHPFSENIKNYVQCVR